MHSKLTVTFALLLVIVPKPVYSEDSLPRPIPVTRTEMKKWLESVKTREPRIPLPELTEADRVALGERADSYESRLRHQYLDGDSRQGLSLGQSRVRGREQDPNMTLDYGFKVELFWIVSRANNCHYCLGHQESKLLAAGRDEDRIARLDGNWLEFSNAERAAYEFARKLTYQPYRLGDDDIVALQKYYSDLQIVEMIVSLSWNNSINRWKEAVGVAQNAEEGGYSRITIANGPSTQTQDELASLPRGTYLTPTSPAYANQITGVAPVADVSAASEATAPAVCVRPALEPRDVVTKQLEACRTRKSRLPLASEDVTRSVMSLSDDNDVPNWLRLLAHFPLEAQRRGQTLLDAINDQQLPPELKAQLAWIIARQDRAWYALAHAREQGLSLGFSEDQMFSLDGDWQGFTEREQSLFRLAKHLAASPVVLTDQDVAACITQAGPAEVVRTIQYVTQLCAFDRLTEAAGLRHE